MGDIVLQSDILGQYYEVGSEDGLELKIVGDDEVRATFPIFYVDYESARLRVRIEINRKAWI